MWLAVAAHCLLATFSGCATLPAFKRQGAQEGQAVKFEGIGGSLSVARSAAILERLEGEAGASEMLDKHLAYEQAVNIDSPLVLGNAVTLLQDGPATYESMFAAMRAARDHINLETYIMDDDEVGRQFADLLLEKRAQGVKVNLIYDSFGCRTTPATFFDRLRTGGVEVLEFNPVNPLAQSRRWRPNNRDHRKLLVVDGRVAFVGGINVSKVYSSNPLSRRARKPAGSVPGWRDIHSRIEGPVVAEFQKLFVATWTKQRGVAPPPAEYFPVSAPAGDNIVRAIGDSADNRRSPLYLTFMSAISHAEHSVRLTVAYFTPDPRLLEALCAAARRGVEVDLILPNRSDSWLVLQLGRSHYRQLLRAGVRIHERRNAVMHAKTASIDGVWSTIGSTNLDRRSFVYNDEVNAVILGRSFARQMDAMFAKDLAESEEITLDKWRRRSFAQRLQERVARLAAPLL